MIPIYIMHIFTCTYKEVAIDPVFALPEYVQ